MARELYLKIDLHAEDGQSDLDEWRRTDVNEVPMPMHAVLLQSGLDSLTFTSRVDGTKVVASYEWREV